jgi:hypothetical protein
MHEIPAINILLAGVEKLPDTTLGDLLTFMKVFNFRFGEVLLDAGQQEVYNAIYPLLVQLRAESELAIASQTTADVVSPGSAGQPGELFTGMDLKNLDEEKVPEPRP